MARSAPSVPWAAADATRLVLANLSGAAVVLIGYVGVSGASRLSTQFGWLSVAVLGFLVAGVTDGLWLMAGRRAIGTRLNGLLIAYPPILPIPDQREAGDTGPAARTAQRPSDSLVTAASMTRYHRADCLLVRGKELSTVQRDTAESAGLRRCEVCLVRTSTTHHDVRS